MPEPQPTGACRRRSGRIVQESLISNLGQVVDLSKGGMRVRCRRFADHGAEPVEVTFDSVELPWKLRAELLWRRSLESGEHEAGFHFIDITPEQASWLAEIAMRYSFSRQLPDAES